MSDKTRKWRTLVRVEGKGSKYYSVVLPGWAPDQQVLVPIQNVPFDLEEGQRCHARVNIGAGLASELRFNDWEEK